MSANATPSDVARILRHPDQLYIDGEWRRPSSNDALTLVSPVDDAIVGRVALAGAEDLDAAIAAARHAFDEGPWPRWSPQRRLDCLERLTDSLEKRKAELAECWTLQIGGLASFAPRLVAGGIANLRAVLEIARCYPFVEQVRSSASASAWVVHEPVGVVAAIVPWNSPFALLTLKIAPALAAGCTVIMKPSPETPLEAFIVAECAEEVAIPSGVLNLLPAGRDIAAKLVADARVDKISFTGSTDTGRAIAAVCATRIARCTLELGGKSAAIVCDDFPLDEAAKILARTIITLSGQICSILSRALVPRGQQGQIAAAIAEEMSTFRVGSPDDPATDMGPLASRRQFERVMFYIESARRQGATLVIGGKQPAGLQKGCFVEPTLFSNVSPTMTIAQEEVFGPVLCLIPYDTEDEAISIANNTMYGLNGAVLTRDAARAYRIGRRIRTGKFSQNGYRIDASLPSGGVKQSGVGREGGKEGLMAYLETKVMLMDQPPPVDTEP
jgi:aldehyde dehydrogenase (NAD+)